MFTIGSTTLSAILYSLCIIQAVLTGATGGLVPADSFWFMIIQPFPTHFFLLTIALFTTFLPLLVIVNLTTVLFRYTFNQKHHSFKGILGRIFIGVLFAFPILYITVALYIICGSAVGWWLVMILLSGLAAGFLVLYQFSVFVITSENSKQIFRECISSPRVWSFVIVFTGILLFPSLMLVNPLHKGYFRYFPTSEIFLLNLPDLVARASLLGVLLSIVHYGVLFVAINFRRRLDSNENGLSL